LGLNSENSDMDFVTTDSHVYNKTMKLLREMEKQGLVNFKQIKKEKIIEKRQGSLIFHEKAGYEDVSVYSNPIVEGVMFDLHLVDKILSRERQLAEHLLKHNKSIKHKINKLYSKQS